MTAATSPGPSAPGGLRVAILGGGMAALSTAWRLSSDPSVGRITVYQRGWRLGGKAASSRGEHGRIEEHGLHVWLGYYDNAFRVMRECYAALDRPSTAPDCPIRTWRDAFAPSSAVGLASRVGGGWEDWTAFFSGNDELPGEPEVTTEQMSPAGFVLRAQRLVRDFAASLDVFDGRSATGGRIVLSADPRPPVRPDASSTAVRRAFDAAAALALEVTSNLAAAAAAVPLPAALTGVVSLLDGVRGRLASIVGTRPGARRAFEVMDIVLTSVRGVVADGLLTDPRGFGAINGEEFRDWLLRHGACPESLDSPLLVGMYDLVFGYRNGDPTLPRVAAGTGLFLGAKLFFEYKGSIFWKMQAGMGDVVVAPLYQALQERGVRFELFHDVRSLVPSEDGTRLEAVHLVRQVELADGVESYEPLVDVGGLPCFPAAPLRAQLRDDVADPWALETLWCRDRPGADVELRVGRDVDVVVYALSVGMVPHTCAEIVARQRRWQLMARHLGRSRPRPCSCGRAPARCSSAGDIRAPPSPAS